MTPSYRRIPKVKLDGRRHPVANDASLFERDLRRQGIGPGPEDEVAEKIQKAYEAGYQAGQAAAIKETESAVATRTASLTSMIDDVVSQRALLVGEAEEAVLRLTCQIAKRIVEKVVEIDQETIARVVRAGLGRLADSQKATVRVNPADMEVLSTHQAKWLSATRSGTSIEIKTDERIKRGGCLIEGSSGNIEAEIERQLEVIERALVGAIG